ncbi:MAG: gliding motility-associated C-terminal domain-containing protein [Flavobacteriales bacterium]|nr:gliding motility-associated C-terminal domain-containing protein [Flavobacteriales bacterium]
MRAREHILRTMLAMALAGVFAGVHAQGPWDTPLRGLGAEHVSDVKVGADGFIYATGEFSNVVFLGTQSMVSYGATDCFVAKLDAAGNVLWMRQAGGASADRGIRLAVEGNAVVVVGQWMGTADLFGSTFTSLGPAQDAFTARLNTSDGATQWVRTGGGAVGVTRPNGVTLAPNGHTTVAGEFRGTATFGTVSITSMPDTFTMDPGIDVFIASYNASGALLWLKHGAGMFTDRAVDVVHDASGDLYVGGQFSDTLTFSQTYANTLFNAIFLLKLDAAGDEVWFRKGGGAQLNALRDMQWSAMGELLLAGDLRGTMTWFDAAPNTLAAGAPYAIFLLRVSLSGEFIGASTTGSDNPVTLRGIDQRADTVAVVGEFRCRFTGLSDLYGGEGLFMATGTQDLFVNKHRFSDLALLEGQQFGGQKGKRAGQIASLPNGALIFCGSFSQLLTFPSDASTWADLSSGVMNCSFVNFNSPAVTWCGDPHHGRFVADRSDGQRDGFIARGYVNGRSAYDFWRRADPTDCGRGVIEPCIETFEGVYRQCPDSSVVCEPLPLRVMGRDWSSFISPISWLEDESWPTFVCDSAAYTGPDLEFLWSDGSLTRQTLATTTGWYWCTVSTTNGCWSWTDSIHVTVGPVPPLPHISDATGANVNAAFTTPLFLCSGPEWIWVSDPLPGYQYIWYESGVAYPGDSILADTNGIYIIHAVGPNGCINFNFIQVFIWGSGEPLPNITGVEVDFQPDSATICPMPCGYMSGWYGTATWFVNGVPTVLTGELGLTTTVDCGPPPAGLLYAPPDQPFPFAVYAPQPGWNTFTVALTVNNGIMGCATQQVAFNVTDSIYLEIVPTPDLQLFGPSFICPGDTVLLTASCPGCAPLTWMGPGIIWISSAGDSMRTVLGGQFSASSFTEMNGVSCPVTEHHFVLPPTAPEVFLASEQMCPGDSVLLSTNLPGSNYQWTGPLGPLSGTGPTVYANAFGVYQLTMLDTNNCVVTGISEPLDQYGSPLVDIFPEVFLCPGESAQIEVFAEGPVTIAWAPPLTGGSAVQTVSSPGVYTVVVTSCGIPYPFTIPVYGSQPNVELATPGPFELCPGDTVVLMAYPGAADYVWLPWELPGMHLVVGDGGAFQAVVVDEYGCMDTSAVVVVNMNNFTTPLQANDVTVCLGEDAVLIATGSGVIRWYADAALTQLMATGATLVVPSPPQDQVFFATQEENGCISATVQVQVWVLPTPTGLLLNAPAALCLGQEAMLFVSGTPTPEVNWSTPAGPFWGNPLVIDPVTVANAGTYTGTAGIGPCIGGTVSVTLTTVVPAAYWLGPDSLVCPAQPFPLVVPAEFNNISWSTGDTGPTALVTLPGSYWFTAQDANGCLVTDTVYFGLVECDPFMPNVITPNGDGRNDLVELWSPSAAPLVMRIFNRWGQTVHEAEGRQVRWDGRSNGTRVPDGVYYYEVRGERVNGSALVLTGYVHVL